MGCRSLRPGLLYRAALEGATFSLYAGEVACSSHRRTCRLSVPAAFSSSLSWQLQLAVQAWCSCNNMAQQRPSCACVEAGPKICCGNRFVTVAVNVCSSSASGLHCNSSASHDNFAPAVRLHSSGRCRLLRTSFSCQ
jgi:hypothetical protein